MHLIDTFNTFFGWCPQVRMLPRPLTVLNYEAATSAPSQGNGIPERTESLNRYRNRALLRAVFLTLVSVPFVAYFQTTDLTRLLFFLGMTAGLWWSLPFLGSGFRNSLEMLEKGMVIKNGTG